MPVILPTITPETTPATELIRILYKQLCTRVVEKGCEFQSFKTIIERTHTIHSCLEKRITGIVQGNKFECSELMAYTKAVGLLEQWVVFLGGGCLVELRTTTQVVVQFLLHLRGNCVCGEDLFDYVRYDVEMDWVQAENRCVLPESLP